MLTKIVLWIVGTLTVFAGVTVVFVVWEFEIDTLEHYFLALATVSLIVSLFTLWLNYRNRLDQQRLEKSMDAETTLSSLNRCDVLIENADAFFREFWRIALSEAHLKPDDYDKINAKISESRSTVRALRSRLTDNAEDETRVQEVLGEARRIEAAFDSLQTSLGHNLASLKREADLASAMSEHDRVEKLRTVIAHIKQWKDL